MKKSLLYALGFDFKPLPIDASLQRMLLFSFSIALWLFTPLLCLPQDGNNDASFNPDDVGFGNSDYTSIILGLQEDGKLILSKRIPCTSFCQTIIRLNADGSEDQSFTEHPINGGLISIDIQTDGKIILGGYFYILEGEELNRVIRLNSDGSLDTSFEADIGFLDDTAFTPTKIILQTDGKILVSGLINPPNPNEGERSFIVRLESDGTLDPSFSTGTQGFDGEVMDFELQPDGKILVAGKFTRYQFQPCPSLIRLEANGSFDTSFELDEEFEENILSILLAPDNKIYLASTTFDLSLKIARLFRNGDIDNDFLMDEDISILNQDFWNLSIPLALQEDGSILIGGYLAAWLSEEYIPHRNLFRFDENGNFDETFSPINYYSPFVSLARTIYNIVIQPDNKMLVIGSFSNFNGALSPGIVRLNEDGSNDDGFLVNNGSGISNEGLQVGLQSDDKIIISGYFDGYNGLFRKGIARLNPDGSLDENFNLGWLDDIQFFINYFGIYQLIVQPDDKILIAGDFFKTSDNIGGLARLNSDGTADTDFTPPEGFSFNSSMALQADGKLLAVQKLIGSFGLGPSYKLIRLNTDGSLDNTFGSNIFETIGEYYPNTPIFSLAIQEDGKILVCKRVFSIYNYTNVLLSKILRLNTDGTLDTGFDTDLENVSSSFTHIQADGKILLQHNSSLVRLNPDGILDTSFPNNISFSGGDINTLIEQEDGYLVIGGSFTSFMGVESNRLVKLDPGGSFDTDFEIGSGFETVNNFDLSNTTASVNSLALQNNKILAIGDFTSFNGVGRNYIARLNNSIADCAFIFTPVSQNRRRCEAGTVTFSASGASEGEVYVWLEDGTLNILKTSQNQDDNTFTTPVLNSNTNYEVLIQNVNTLCQSQRKLVGVIISPIPSIPLAEDIRQCGEGEITFNASGANEGEVYIWLEAGSENILKTSQNQDDNTFTTPILNNNTNYEVLIQRGNGICQSERKLVQAIIRNLPPMPMAEDVNVTIGNTVTFTATGAGTSQVYKWYEFGEQEALYTSNTQLDNQFSISDLTESTSFEVSIFDLNSMCESERKTIQAILSEEIILNNVLLPQLFTPNNDGKNDRLLVRGTNLAKVDLKVYDRRGNLIHKTQNLQEAAQIGWDGGNQPTGTYQIWLQVQFNNGENQTIKSLINLMR